MNHLDMYIYKRSIRRNLASLRLFGFLSVLTSVVLLVSGNERPAYLLILILIGSCFLKVSDFRVTKASFSIGRYFVFGFFRQVSEYNRGEKIKIISDAQIFGEQAEIPVYDSEGSLLGLLFSWIYPLFGKPRVARIRFSFQKDTGGGNLTQPVYIMLDKSEYQMAAEIMLGQDGI